MNGKMPRTPNEHRLFAVMLNHERRGVALIAFERGGVVARDLLGQIAAGHIKGRQPRIARVHAGHDDILVGHYR